MGLLTLGKRSSADEAGRSEVSRRRRLLDWRIGFIVLCALVAIPAVALAGVYQPDGTVPSFCQGTGEAAGRCEEIKSVAVDASNGNVFAVDINSAAGGNARIDEFSPSGAFVRALGYDVTPGGAEGTGNLNSTTTVSSVATTNKAFTVGQEITAPDNPGAIPAGTTIQSIGTNSITLSQAATVTTPGVTLKSPQGAGNVSQNEKQTVIIPPTTTTGTFKLTFSAPQPQIVTNPQTTVSIAYNAPATDPGTPGTIDSVQEALESLTNVGAGNVAVSSSSGTYTIEFTGKYTDTNVNQVTAAATGFSLPAANIVTTQEGTAAESCTTLCKKGTEGTFTAGQLKGAGSLNFNATGAGGIAIDPETHIVYAMSRGNASEKRISYWDGADLTGGSFLGEFNGTTVGMGANPQAPAPILQSTGVAIDSGEAQHYLYIASGSGSTSAVDKFKVPVPAGGTPPAYQCQVTGRALASQGQSECKHTTESEDLAHPTGISISGQTGGNIAVDSSGNLYVAEEVARNAIAVFDEEGRFLKHITATAPVAVAAGAPGRILVADGGSAAGGSFVQEFDTASGSVTSKFGAGTITTNGSLGLARSPLNGHVYVADKPAKKIWNFSLAAPAVPSVSEQVTAGVDPVEGELKAQVRVNGGSADFGLTGCHFDYVTQAAYTATQFTDLSSGGSLPCVPPFGTIPNDGQFQPVHAEAEGLTPATTYRWHLVATNAQGTTEGAAESFTSGEAHPPKIESESLGAISTNTAEVKATINPEFAEVNAANTHVFGVRDCHFEYYADVPGAEEVKTVACQTPSNLGHLGAGVPTKSVLTGLLPNTTYHWRAYAANSEGHVEGAMQTFTTWVEPATASTSAVGSFTETTATLNGSVANHGASLGSTCEFQVAKSSDSGYAAPVWTGPCSPNPVLGSGAQPVSATATGLSPNTAYIYRVRAKNQGNEQAGLGFSNGSSVAFSTVSKPALIQSAVGPTETGITLIARIDPAGQPTTYHLEYVDEATYEADQPNGFLHATKTAESASIGADHSSHEVTQQLEGLSAGAEYRYRFVATNGGGSTAAVTRSFTTRSPIGPCANDARREENHSMSLHDCRAYEQVSPVDKNLGSASNRGGGATAAWEGNALAFCTTSQFGEPAPEQGGIKCGNGAYLSRRGPAGWETRALTPNYCPRDLSATTNQNGVGASAIPSPETLDFGVVLHPETAGCSAYPPLDPAAPLPGLNLYRADLTGGSPNYQLLALAPAFGTTANNINTARYQGGSKNLSHVVFRSSGAQTPDAIADGRQMLFDWSNGAISLVSKAPDNSVLSGDSAVPSSGEAGVSDGINAVSRDGSRIFFQNPLPGATIGCTTASCELFLREDDAQTYWVSQQECSTACSNTAGADSFVWATPSGDKALFRTSAKLNDEDTGSAGEDLYMFTKSADPANDPHNLTLLSGDQEPSDGTAANVLGTLGMSDDASTVYFVAAGQLVAGKPTGAGSKVYRWRWNGGSPQLDYLATLEVVPLNSNPAEDDQNWVGYEENSGANSPVSRLVTPDGSTLLIETRKALDPIADRDAARDVYRWTAEGGWTCLSCQAPGSPSAGESAFDAHEVNGVDTPRPTFGLHAPMSDDGGRVFFASKDALVPTDVNGLEDVYEWQDGVVNLVSTGTGPRSTLAEASHSGDDVFFLTTQQVVNGDTDPTADMYDARVGGGFPAPPPPPPPAPCEAGGCANAAPPAPAAPTSATAANSGAGNTVRCHTGFVKRKGVCVKKRAKKRHAAKRRHHRGHRGVGR